MKREHIFRSLAVAAGLGLGLLVADQSYRLLRSKPSSVAEDPTQVCNGHFHRPAVWTTSIGGSATVLSSTLRPFCRAVDFDVRHNSQGFRGPEYTTRRPPATFRVSVVGDSYTWGQGVTDDQLFTAVAQRQLTADLPESHTRVEILNHGAQGSRFVDHLIRLQAHVEDLEPDLIVVQFTPNDLEWTHLFPFFTQLNRRDLSQQHADRLPLFGRLPPPRLGALMLAERRRPYDPESLEWSRFQLTIAAMSEFGRQMETPIVILAFPDVADGTRPQLEEGDPDHLRRALESFESAGFDVIDLEPIFDQQASGVELVVSSHDQHPSSFAHELAGRTLASYLSSRFPGSPGIDQSSAWQHESRLRLEAEANWVALNQQLTAQQDLFDRLIAAGLDSPWLIEQRAYLALLAGDHLLSGRLLDQLPSDSAVTLYTRGLIASGADAQHHMNAMLERIPDHAFTLEWILSQQTSDQRDCEQIARMGRNPLSVSHLRRALEWHRESSCGSPYGSILPSSWQ